MRTLQNRPRHALSFESISLAILASSVASCFETCTVPLTAGLVIRLIPMIVRVLGTNFVDVLVLDLAFVWVFLFFTCVSDVSTYRTDLGV